VRVEQAPKAPEQKAPNLNALEQTGKLPLLLIAVLCAVAALLGLALLRGPAPAVPSATAPSAAAPAAVSASGTAASADRQAALEARLREQVEEMIGAIVGRDKVRAVVSAEIEPDQTRQVSVGEPGADGAETITTRSSGRIRRLTVSVMVDSRRVEGPDGIRYEPRTEAERARFTRLARSAVGFDALRGDSLTVETVRFAPAETGPSFLGVRADAVLPAARALLVGILALAALVLILRAFTRRQPAPASTPVPETAEPTQPTVLEPFARDAAYSPALRRAGEAVAASPAAAAGIVRRWMSA